MTSQVSMLEALLRQQPHIPYVTPSSPNYKQLREAYILGTTVEPLAITRPQTANDVALLVSHAVNAGLPLTVRSGGHDLFGRCFASGALAIDMRDINSVHIAADCRSASVGGGVLASHLAAKLSAHGLATAMGSAPTVGWVGWATHGGYGPFAANYGLGADQILDATVVDGYGRVVEADGMMLQAIRGGGGCVGIIVRLTIKTYPLDEIIGGTIMYETDNTVMALSKFVAGYKPLAEEGLPDTLGIQPSFVNTPMGRMFVVAFVWSSDDLELGYNWLAQIEALGKVLHNSVKATTVKDWLDDAGSFLPRSAYGGSCTASVRQLTDEVNEVVDREIAKMPADPAVLFSAHELRGKSTAPRADSVFAARAPHYVLEFVATSSSQDMARQAQQWGNGFRHAVLQTASDNLLPLTYISLTPPKDADYPTIYGTHWERLVAIKKKYDPKNVFRHSMPQFVFPED
ncbi:hypothetical protein NW757_014144 [Fusarium falciforme]|nr:hypothetical protein NW757_014144 [Fusarium falciforme]